MNSNLSQQTIKSPNGDHDVIVTPCQFGVLVKPKVEHIHSSDEERQEIMRNELLWIAKNRRHV